MKNARDAYAQADYRWAAEILKHIVLNNPQNQQAKDLLANTYRQLGYAAEASTWRNFFLVGAQELQNNVPLQNTSDPSDLLIHTPTERFLEAMATNLDVENLKNENQCINLVLSDTQENFSLWVENSVMQFKRYDESKDLALDCPTLTLTKPLYLKMITGQIEGVKVLLSKDSKVKGNPLKIGKFFAMFKRPDSIFPIVTRPNG